MMHWRFRGRVPTVFAILTVLAPPLRAGDSAIRDGDTVVFLGDSITAARTYGKIIENYTLLRFPDRRVRFVNAGWGGDTAAGGLARLDRDVLDRGATLVTVAYGINDIGWGMRADAEHRQRYLDAVRGIVERCRARGVRAYICSAAITAEDPDQAETGFLQKMCDDGLAVARAAGGSVIDVQRTMRRIQRRLIEANARLSPGQKKESLHAEDGVHLNEYGQIAMAFAILKGLGAPADVSSVEIDARGPELITAAGCSVERLTREGDRIEFTRRDSGLPLNLGLVGLLSYRFIPIPDELNRYMLTVRGLPDGPYEIIVNGRTLGTFESRQLADGVNLCSATPDPWVPGGPWDAQATVLRNLTDARHENALGHLHIDLYLAGRPGIDGLRSGSAEIDRQIVQMQRAVARPVPYRYVLRPTTRPAR